MTQLTKKRGNGNGSSFPSQRTDLLTSRFFGPRLFDFDDDFFSEKMSAPPANITETSKEFKLDLSVPGMEREDFHVDVDNKILIISSEKEEEKKEEDKNYRRREFSYNSFCRTFQLPDSVDEDKINAKYENGMLQVTIPKKETGQSNSKKQIKVS
jgi:HSP20 family protein